MMTVRAAPVPAAASRTCCNRLRPARRCKTLGKADFIRVPLPAAMITTFNAMPMSRIKTVIIGLLMLLTGPFLTGCSALRLGYANGSTLAWIWIDGYFDFSRAQSPDVQKKLDNWFAWHRSSQLPAYAALLAGLHSFAIPLGPELVR